MRDKRHGRDDFIGSGSKFGRNVSKPKCQRAPNCLIAKMCNGKMDRGSKPTREETFRVETLDGERWTLVLVRNVA